MPPKKMKPVYGYALQDRESGKIVWCGMRKPGRYDSKVYLDCDCWTTELHRLIRIKLLPVTKKK